MTATSHGLAEPTLTGCLCDDPEVDQLRDLIAQGVDQRTASALLWGRPSPSTVRAWVRHQYARALPWLRLPTDPGGAS